MSTFERRSARLQAAPVKSLQEDPDYEDDGAADMDVDDLPVASSSKTLAKPRGKKRKSSEEPQKAQPTKKLRGKRGLLKDLVEMPMDVLFEIFGQLDPMDLLHLARTTKAFRNILMNKTSISIWKNAFETVDPPLPECPDDLSEPAYADLALGKNCYFCGRHTSSMHIAWQCRVRSCSKCIDNNFASDRQYVGHGYPREVGNVVPTISVMRYNGRYSRMKTFYWRARDQEWKNEYDDIESKQEREEWSKKKVAEAEAIREHSALCIQWAKERAAARERDKEAVIEERRAIVVEHLRNMGWGEEYDRIRDDSDKPERKIEVTKACSKTLTDRVLNNLEPSLKSTMEKLRRDRIDRERREFLEARLVILRDTYDNYIATIPSSFGHPNTADIFQSPVIQDIINDSPTPDLSEEHIDLLVDAFPQATEAFHSSVREQLLVLIVESLATDKTPQFQLDPETVLDEASTFFYCKECQREVPTREAAMHSCARTFRSWDWYSRESTAEDTALRSAIQEICWNSAKTFNFHYKMAYRVGMVLKNLGYDPKNFTADDMDSKDPIIECLKCHNERLGRFTMRWSCLAVHLQFDDIHDLQKHFRIVDEPEATVVRQRIAEKRAMTFADSGSADAVCGHCREKGANGFLLTHTRTAHNISRPKLGQDIIPNPFANPSRDFKESHRLWPPLAQEDVDELISA